MINVKLRVNNIYFVGIGGSGMSGIAEILFNLGYNIVGSDTNISANTIRLKKLGIKIYSTHHQNNIKNMDAIVISSAINDNNIELQQARKLKIPIVPRAEMLAEIMRFRFGIAISGTHGKTTTTSLISHLLSNAKLDPTYIIGGILKAEGIGNHLGYGDYIVAEADESDKSFLHLNPMLSVITNIDEDHIQTYDFNYKNLQQAFIDFTSRLPFYGICIACIDDKGVKQIIPNISRKVITYGFCDKADIRVTDVNYLPNSTNFQIITQKNVLSISTMLLGKHNVQNILATVAVCLELDVDHKTIIQGIKSFKGIHRRMELKGVGKINDKKIQIFDDYAHHPTEIKSVVTSITQAKGRQPIIIFQPHRYSRTRDLWHQFITTLQLVKKLIVLPIYSAGEKSITNITSAKLVQNIGHGTIANNFKEVINELTKIIEDNDIVITLGAGDITKLSSKIYKKYAIQARTSKQTLFIKNR